MRARGERFCQPRSSECAGSDVPYLFVVLAARFLDIGFDPVRLPSAARHWWTDWIDL